MPNFSFRLRFLRSPTDTIRIDAPTWEWTIGEGIPPLVLRSHRREDPIKDSEALVFESEGWPSQEAAAQAAERYVPALALTLVKLRVGADFGRRAPKSVVTPAGLAMFEKCSGSRVLNDVHGLMVYESEPRPRFAKVSGTLSRGVDQRHFEQVFSRAVERAPRATEREKLALDLFNASFFQQCPDSRFLVLVMAIEALLDPPARGGEALAHVESMIAGTRECGSLSDDQKQSLLGSLEWLKYESIRQTGRELASSVLGGRKYMDKEAPAFFLYCYDLRSRLVHGRHPLPTWGEVGAAAAQLERFVSDLLSGDLRDIEFT